MNGRLPGWIPCPFPWHGILSQNTHLISKLNQCSRMFPRPCDSHDPLIIDPSSASTHPRHGSAEVAAHSSNTPPQCELPPPPPSPTLSLARSSIEPSQNPSLIAPLSLT
ncbi:hypothetical protein BT67DRAFT_23941 [Trichocladium antarcticum]|uniref:Uncharacterized protein n=1 Tax=Trichocladium antarcticum TaxID=1450529 RepID=A0AAN6UVX6_9PEZI|nr:hypothetical protein BT67DRAFT_23941 [Trichocladium antarcticum]